MRLKERVEPPRLVHARLPGATPFAVAALPAAVAGARMSGSCLRLSAGAPRMSSYFTISRAKQIVRVGW